MAAEIRGLLETELEAHAELVHASYHEYVLSGERSFLADPQWWLKAVTADPYYAPDQTRVMIMDGKLVASVTNYTREVHADGRLAKVSCIGSVCTHPDYRQRGLVRQVLAESIEWMESEHFGWSSLFGKEEVYGGSGWTILTSFTCTADLRVRGKCGAEVQQWPATTDEVAMLVRLYDGFNENLTGPIWRNEEYWLKRVLAGRFDQEGPTYWLLELGDEVIGYYTGDDGHVREVGWVDQPAEVMGFLLRQWAGQPVRFNCFTGEMLEALRAASHMPSARECNEHAGGVTLAETYKGLWRYIGEGRGEFPEIEDTGSMLRFLRKHEYNFWPADGY